MEREAQTQEEGVRGGIHTEAPGAGGLLQDEW